LIERTVPDTQADWDLRVESELVEPGAVSGLKALFIPVPIIFDRPIFLVVGPRGFYIVLVLIEIFSLYIETVAISGHIAVRISCSITALKGCVRFLCNYML